MKAHQDNYKKRSNHQLKAQLNCFHDDLEKVAVVDGIMDAVERRQKLPLESVCVFIGNNKQTTDLVKGPWYFIRKENEKGFYAAKEVMDPATFNTVKWDDLHDTLAFKPKIYQRWFRKPDSRGNAPRME